jgi:glycosyltransferase involved in cell wall biosynthesis
MERVSVILPVYNEADHIARAVESICAATPAGVDLEVLVVDGMSTDGTRGIVRGLAERHPSVRLLDNPEKTVPFAMNRGIREAQGSVIIRVDGHATVAPDFIRSCLEELAAHPECGCVGGFIENVHDTATAEAISLAMSSRFGVGNALFRLGTYEGYVDTLAFGAYRKPLLEQIGLFDEVLTRNQDDELNYRLIKAGHKIWLSKRIRSTYYVRASIKKLFRQYYQYGYWKVYVNQKHRAVTSLRQLAPIGLVVFIGAGGVLSLLVPVTLPAYLLGLCGYLGLGLVSAVRLDRKLWPRILPAFWTLHLGYGLGYLEGVWHFVLLGAQVSR